MLSVNLTQEKNDFMTRYKYNGWNYSSEQMDVLLGWLEWSANGQTSKVYVNWKKTTHFMKTLERIIDY